MRITNSMITNGMLLNMNRNVKNVNNLYNQLSTGKKIQQPSDDPILASRALKFRTNVVETEQYQKNVDQATSWMEVTEAAYNNINKIMLTIRDLTERGASDTLTYEDRQKIITDINSLVQQVGMEMNVTYAGRYVFSGYRTDEPPVFTEDNKFSYEDITQYFTPEDIETTKGYYQNINASTVTDGVKILKLAYTGLSGIEITNKDLNGSVLFTKMAVPKDITDPSAYTPGINKINYIKETGELVFGANVTLNSTDSLQVKYNKEGFAKGELNPKIYFSCKDQTPGSPTIGELYNVNIGPPNNERQQYELEFSVNTRVPINSSAIDVFSDKMYADLNTFIKIVGYANSKTREEITSAASDADTAAKEVALIQDTLQNRFKNMLGMIDKHTADIATAHTDLGSRMSRLELIGNRLGDDNVSYTKLLSENEDVDYMKAMMELNSAESVYQASLMAGSKIMQLSLANYI